MAENPHFRINYANYALSCTTHNMGDTTAKSSRLFHTSHNMQYQVTTMYQTGENGVCPKAARACPNPRSLHILRPHFF